MSWVAFIVSVFDLIECWALFLSMFLIWIISFHVLCKLYYRKKKNNSSICSSRLWVFWVPRTKKCPLRYHTDLNFTNFPTRQNMEYHITTGLLILIGWNKFFVLFDQSKFVLTQSHCSSTIASKDFGGTVNPLFCPACAGCFPHFIYKEVSHL